LTRSALDLESVVLLIGRHEQQSLVSKTLLNAQSL